ncbi:MAG: rhodanese-like domain-containing protein [Clostridiales bacterium]|nr:rhodanese-like domain-containing protein [Clostridiales bacterium]
MESFDIDICKYASMQDEKDIVVDLRNPDLFSFGSLPQAINIPLDRLGELMDLPYDRKVYVFCQAGEKSEGVAELLRQMGYEAWNLSGGYREYLKMILQETI